MPLDRIITQPELYSYRQYTYRCRAERRINSKTEAIDFVNQRGFVFFWPIKAAPLPSLWCAAAGDRPVLNDHDDPGHITWRWKDDLLGSRKWYYAKILRRKSTIISLELADSFGAQAHRYPALIPARHMERVNYFSAFPHSLSFVTHLREDLNVIDHFAQSASCNEYGELITPPNSFARWALSSRRPYAIICIFRWLIGH